MKKISLLISCVFAFSCTTNEMYFNVNTGHFISNNVITKIVIEGIDNDDYYTLSLKKGVKSPKMFEINEFKDFFEIKDIFNVSVHPDTIIKASFKYKITNVSNGDAAGYSILIKINSKNLVELLENNSSVSRSN